MLSLTDIHSQISIYEEYNKLIVAKLDDLGNFAGLNNTIYFRSYESFNTVDIVICYIVTKILL